MQISDRSTFRSLVLGACAGCLALPALGQDGVPGTVVVAEEPEAIEVFDPTAVAAEAARSSAAEPLEETDGPLTNRRAFERAIEWAAEGLRAYESGDHDTARRYLADSRIMLLQADLPEVVQEQGLGVLHCTLSEELRHHDLEAVVEILEFESRPSKELAEDELIEREVRRILRRFGAPPPQDKYMRIFLTEVQRYVRYYRGNGREFFERSYGRMHKYLPTVEEVFEPRNIPVELIYMALVESGFNPRARSHAGARGLWQFIPATGKRYGLRRVDDFYDVRASTEAASEYLLDLIGIFGSRSFLLATAAYNAGEGRIQGCLRKLEDPFGGRTFWAIRGCLARETREYVPRILAAAVIGADPERFGFDLSTRQEVKESYDIVTIPSVTSLSRIAKQAGVKVSDLRAANSDLASTATATPGRNFPLYVPRGGAERLAAVRPTRSAPTRRPVTSGRPQITPPAAEPAPAEMRVRQPPGEPRTAVEARPRQQRPRTADGNGIVYRVRRGDTLSEIASRHGVRTASLAGWNNLFRPYRIYVGQRLTIYPSGAPPKVVYIVKRGNSLGTIANLFSVRYRDIMNWNKLRSSKLSAGQKLIIHPPRAMRLERYNVRRGDTVARIASRFGVTVQSVLTANGLYQRTLIQPGQRLLVYVNA